MIAKARRLRRRPADVIVLSTLHRFHAQVRPYGFSQLAAIVEALRPDVLALELTSADLAARLPTAGKPEYAKAIYPLLDNLSVQLLALEPDEPRHKALVRAQKRALLHIRRTRPKQLRTFVRLMTRVMAHLVAAWDSPLAVNDRETDRLFEAKHALQEALFPELTSGWNRWNSHFLRKITSAASTSPGKRIVALVGAEHSYWLRKRLKRHERVKLLDCAQILAGRRLDGACLDSSRTS